MQREGREARFLVRVSCLEVYQEVVSDLLCPRRARLALREDLRQGVHAELLTEETIASGAHAASVHGPALQSLLVQRGPSDNAG